MSRRVIITEPFARHEEVEISLDEFLGALLQNTIYYCKHCTLERGSREVYIWHLVGNTDWDQAIAAIKG